MATLKIEIKKNKININGEYWGKMWGNPNLKGDCILNLLFYRNKEGNKFELIIDGVNETKSFIKEVKNKYADAKNTELRERFYKIATVK